MVAQSAKSLAQVFFWCPFDRANVVSCRFVGLQPREPRGILHLDKYQRWKLERPSQLESKPSSGRGRHRPYHRARQLRRHPQCQRQCEQPYRWRRGLRGANPPGEQFCADRDERPRQQRRNPQPDQLNAYRNPWHRPRGGVEHERRHSGGASDGGEWRADAAGGFGLRSGAEWLCGQHQLLAVAAKRRADDFGFQRVFFLVGAPDQRRDMLHHEHQFLYLQQQYQRPGRRAGQSGGRRHQPYQFRQHLRRKRL